MLALVVLQSGDPAVLDLLIEEDRTGAATTAAAAEGTSDEEQEQQQQQQRRPKRRQHGDTEEEEEEEKGPEAGLGPGSQAKQQKRKRRGGNTGLTYRFATLAYGTERQVGLRREHIELTEHIKSTGSFILLLLCQLVCGPVAVCCLSISCKIVCVLGH
jgi:hypothetical protein